MKIAFGILLGLAAYASACSPGQKKNIDLLDKHFGIKPFYPNGEMETNGYSDEFIETPSDLNCNFNTEESPQPDNGAQKASQCKWKNMKGERSDLDDEQFYLFTKSNSKRNWNSLRPFRRDRPQTPSEGDGFALTGGEGRPDPKSVYYSAPIACSENPTQLAFDYWIYSNAELRVLVLEKDTFKTLWEAPPDTCTRQNPKNGRCQVEIPPQAGPYHLAIHARELNRKFIIIDNIEYTGDLGKNCEGGGDPFDFGTTGTALASRNGAEPITTASDLNCDGGNCKWSNSPNGGVKFEQHTAPVDEEKWRAATAGSSTPSGDFYMARGTEGKAELMGDAIECQLDDGVLEFKAWGSEGTRLEVCVVNAQTFKEVYTCEQILLPMYNDQPYSVPIFGPLDNARILFRASDWNAGNGGFVAIDDISYEALMCSEITTVPTVPTPIITQTTTTAAPSPDEADTPTCEQISTDFDNAHVDATSWRSYPNSQYQGRPVKKHSISDTFDTAQNTRVDCPDGTLCAGVMLDKTANAPVGIMQTEEFRQPLQKDRFLQMTTRRGTYGTVIYLCADNLPNINQNGSAVNPGPKCKAISGPELTYTEYRNGKVTGAVLPQGTTRAYLLFTNPMDSGADRAGFLVDNIQLLKTDAGNSGPLCQRGSTRR